MSYLVHSQGRGDGADFSGYVVADYDAHAVLAGSKIHRVGEAYALCAHRYQIFCGYGGVDDPVGPERWPCAIW